jgi:glucose/arabinose dehydrogenase
MPLASRHTIASALVGLLAVTGCTAPAATPSASPIATQQATATPEPTATATPSATPSPTTAAEGPALALGLVFAGLESPIGVTNDGVTEGTLYVNEQPGRVVAVQPDGSSRVFLDLTDRISAGGERGLLGLAFHPAYAENRRLFVNYSRAASDPELVGDTVISELTAAADGSTVDAATERVLLEVDQPYPNHNGGQLAFAADGYLYIGLGDGGSGGDPHGHGQNPETLLGTILRVDVDSQPAAGLAYAIPPDNPFVAGGGAAEVWAYGLRNPWRFSFDRQTGDLWIGDVGQGAWEEVDRQLAGTPGGENYGWNVLEGNHCFAVEPCDPSAYAGPLTEYPLTDGNAAVIAGHVYRGAVEPALAGRFIFGDYGSGRIWTVRADAAPAAGEVVPPELGLESDLFISAFGEDLAGELYVTDTVGGGLYRVTVADA